MTTATATPTKLDSILRNDLDVLEDGVLLRLLALAMDKVQRRRRQPKKPGRLHRV